MDTPSPKGVYDPDTVARGGTNADTLNDLLRDLPVAIDKESVPSTWNREAHVLELEPDLIVIHRSAFFHALNAEFGFGYAPFPDEQTKTRWRLLYRAGDDKLASFLGLIGSLNPVTKFLVYSRGTSPEWADSEYRRHWVTGLEQRFPALAGRISTLAIAGGVEHGSFADLRVMRQIRGSIEAALDLPKR